MRFGTAIWSLLAVLIISMWVFAVEKGDAASGRLVYGRCAICHGDSGEGKEAIGKALGVTMPHLDSKEVQALDNAALKKILAEGKGKMKPVSLSDKDAADVIAFIRTLKKP